MLAAGLAAIAMAAPGAAEDCAEPPATVVADLITWIGVHSDYDVTSALATPPRIEFCAEGEEISYADGTILVEPGDRAFFDVMARTIHLVEPWDAGEMRDLGVLLHELTHDIQFLNRSWECLNATEWEAYKLHETWLRERGVEPEFDWLLIFFLSRCPRDIHP